MAPPILHAPEARANATFRALLWALSSPGSVQQLPVVGADSMRTIAEALLDLETTYYAPHPALHGQLLRTGARPRPAAEALYQFYWALEHADLAALGAAPVGSYAAPDESATIVIGCALGAGTCVALRGPGIDGAAELRVGGLPTGFWGLRAAAGRYPLGWDIFLCDGDRLVGLPRTTTIEVR